MSRILFAVLAATAMFSGCSSRSDPARNEVDMAVEFVTHSACAQVAREKGWFAEEGVAVRSWDTYVTGVALAAALSSRDLDAAYICLIPAIIARVNGGVPFKIVAGTHRYGYGLAVDPKVVATPSDLGKETVRLACPRPGSAGDVLLERLIDREGLDRKSVLKRVRRMPSPKIVAALKAGKIDAGFCGEHFPTLAEEWGFSVLVTAADLWPDMHGSVLAVRQKMIDEHPDLVAALVRATCRGTRFLCDHPDEGATIVAQALSVATPVGGASPGAGALTPLSPAAVKRSITERLECRNDIDPAQVQKTADLLHEMGYLRRAASAEDLLDLRFLKP